MEKLQKAGQKQSAMLNSDIGGTEHLIWLGTLSTIIVLTLIPEIMARENHYMILNFTAKKIYIKPLAWQI